MRLQPEGGDPLDDPLDLLRGCAHRHHDQHPVLPQGRYTSVGREVVNVKRAAFRRVMLLLLAHEALAVYVVVLRNGTRVTAKEKYQVKGPNAVFVTKIGTLTSIPSRRSMSRRRRRPTR